jgi:hypothetical protein
MIDHTGVLVTDFEKSKKFYSEALKPIGYKLLLEFSASITGSANIAGFGEPLKPDFWIGQGKPNDPRIHVAFQVGKRSLVDAFHQAALAAGGETMARRDCDPTIMRITTAHSFSILTATTSRSSATKRRRRSRRCSKFQVQRSRLGWTRFH